MVDMAGRGEERDPFGLVLRRLDERGCQPQRRSDGRARARCPVHTPDRKPSLTVTVFENRVVLRCWSKGCSKPAILDALGLSWRDLYFGPPVPARRSTIVATYDYVCEDGTTAQKVRYSNKAFPWRIADATARGGFRLGLHGRKPRLYRESDLRDEACVVVVEGEKAVERLRMHDVVATCGYVGANKWSDTWSQALHTFGCRELVILADNDRAGEAHAERVASSMRSVAPATVIRVVTFADLAAGADVVDFLDGGFSVEALFARISAAPIWAPGAAAERRRQEKRAKAALRLRAWRQRTAEAAGRRTQVRPVASLEDRVSAIVDLLTDGAPRSGRAVKAALAGAHGRDAIDGALHAGLARGVLVVENAGRRAKLYSLSADIRGVSDAGHLAADIRRVSPSEQSRTLPPGDSPSKHRVSECPETRNAETRGVRTSVALQRDCFSKSKVLTAVSDPDTERDGVVLPAVGTCCGQHAGDGHRGKPYVPACQLCPASPTYWRHRPPALKTDSQTWRAHA
jgi:hypothetical protein